MKRVLITGGAGFIGSNLANFLVRKNHFVRVLDNLSTQIHGKNPQESTLYKSLDHKIDFMYGSVLKKIDLQKALKYIDTVVHLAAETGTGQSMYSIQHYSEVNISGTSLLLDLIANEKYPVNKIIVASSRAVYGEGDYLCEQDGLVFPLQRNSIDMENGDFSVHCPKCDAQVNAVPTNESTIVRPGSVYGITKLTQEQLVLMVGESIGVSAIAFRYQNVYGPGQSLSNPYTGILSIFSTRMLNHKGVNIFEDGSESRDFVYIDDVVSITAAAIDFDKRINEVVNVGTGVRTEVSKIANSLKTLLGADVPIEVSGQFRIGDIRHSIADLSKAKKLFNFSPSIDFEEGLKRFVDWVKTEEIQVDKFSESLEELKKKGLFK